MSSVASKYFSRSDGSSVQAGTLSQSIEPEVISVVRRSLSPSPSWLALVVQPYCGFDKEEPLFAGADAGPRLLPFFERRQQLVRLSNFAVVEELIDAFEHQVFVVPDLADEFSMQLIIAFLPLHQCDGKVLHRQALAFGRFAFRRASRLPHHFRNSLLDIFEGPRPGIDRLDLQHLFAVHYDPVHRRAFHQPLEGRQFHLVDGRQLLFFLADGLFRWRFFLFIIRRGENDTDGAESSQQEHENGLANCLARTGQRFLHAGMRDIGRVARPHAQAPPRWAVVRPSRVNLQFAVYIFQFSIPSPLVRAAHHHQRPVARPHDDRLSPFSRSKAELLAQVDVRSGAAARAARPAPRQPVRVPANGESEIR
jgi:hypothetical protein